jgi:hypothetical protein
MSEEKETRARRFNDMGDWIARVGIPAAIAFMLLWQTNTKLDALVAKIDRIAVLMEQKR